MRLVATLAIVGLLLAGCSSKPSATDAAGGTEAGRQSADGDQPVAPPSAFEDVSWDGDLGTHFCVVPGGTVVCPTSTLGPPTAPADREQLLFIADTQGPAHLSGNLTLTWEAAEYEITSNLHAMLGIYGGCPDDCGFVRPAGTLAGKSPLTIPLDAIQLADGERFGLYLRPPHSQVLNTGVLVAAGETVHLEGRIGASPA